MEDRRFLREFKGVDINGILWRAGTMPDGAGRLCKEKDCNQRRKGENNCIGWENAKIKNFLFV